MIILVFYEVESWNFKFLAWFNPNFYFAFQFMSSMMTIK